MAWVDSALSGAAFLLSLGALYISRRDWRETYRPLVIARVETVKANQTGYYFDLVVENIGTRPALDIRLTTNRAAVEKCFDEKISDDNKTRAFRVFDDSSRITILAPQASIPCPFGQTRTDPTWIYDSELVVRIEYADRNKRRYREVCTLRMRDSESFTGLTRTFTRTGRGSARDDAST